MVEPQSHTKLHGGGSHRRLRLVLTLPLLLALACGSSGPTLPGPSSVTLETSDSAEPQTSAPRDPARFELPILLLKQQRLLAYSPQQGIARFFEFPVHDALLGRDGAWLLYNNDQSCVRLYEFKTRRHYDTGLCRQDVHLIEWAPDSRRALLMLSTGLWIMLDAAERSLVDLGKLHTLGPPGANGELPGYVGFSPDSQALLFEHGYGCNTIAFRVPVSGGPFEAIQPPTCNEDPTTGAIRRSRYDGGRTEVVWDEQSESNTVYELDSGASLESVRQRPPLFRSPAARSSNARIGPYAVSPSGTLVAHRALRFREERSEPNENGELESKGEHPEYSIEVGRVGGNLKTILDCPGECPFLWVAPDTLVAQNWQRVIVYANGAVRTIAQAAALVTPQNLGPPPFL